MDRIPIFQKTYLFQLLWIAMLVQATASCTGILPTGTPTALPTEDYSTPAPPGNVWKQFTYGKTGVGFRYPANWFIWLDEQNDRVVVLNAPPDSVIALKGYADEFIKIDIALKFKSIAPYHSVSEYIDASVRKSFPPESILSVELLPALAQGYSAVRVTSLGEGETATLYVANQYHLITLASPYVQNRSTQKKYLGVIEQIAGTLTIP